MHKQKCALTRLQHVCARVACTHTYNQVGCYGVRAVPEGAWLCDVCTGGGGARECPEIGGRPACCLCLGTTGALRREGERSSGGGGGGGSRKLAHITCALW
jgi:hypothetical protein